MYSKVEPTRNVVIVRFLKIKNPQNLSKDNF